MTSLVWCFHYDINSLVKLLWHHQFGVFAMTSLLYVYVLWHHNFMCIYYDITFIGVCTMTSLFVVLTGRSLLSWSTGSRAAPPLTFTPSRAVYISSAPSPSVSFILHSYCPSCALSNHYDKKIVLLCVEECWEECFILGLMSSVNREVQVWCRWRDLETNECDWVIE